MELLGFKSFATRTNIEFVDGITGIVGANGSGKSNVIESLKWVLGEQSAKSLRGEKMEDVIFNGTKERPSLGMAEVTLTFENENRWLPLEYNEVSVQRRLFRNGEGQYYINKSRVRLKDVVELFLDTGVGRDSYAIFEQGRIDRLLSESPTDRRSLFEDFAGISKFKFRKEEAEKKLENARVNLERVTDVILGLEKEVVSLQEQAENAERYNELKNRLRVLEMQFEALRVRNFENDIMSKYSQKKKTEDKVTPLAVELKKKEEDMIATELDIQARETEFNRVRDDYANLQREFGEIRSRLETNEERRKVLVKQLDGMEGRLKEGEEREKALKKEYSDKTSELDGLEEDKEIQSDKLLDVQSKIDGLHSEIKRLDSGILAQSRAIGFDRIVSKDDIERLKQELVQAQTRLENYRQAMQEKFEAAKAVQQELDNHEEQEALAQQETAKLKSELGKIIADIDGLHEEEKRLRSENQKTNDEIKQLQQKLRTMDREIMESLEKQAAKIHEFTAKKPALEEVIEAALAGLTEAVSASKPATEIRDAIDGLRKSFGGFQAEYEAILGIMYSEEGAWTQKENAQNRIEELTRSVEGNDEKIEALRARTHDLQAVREDIQNACNKNDYGLATIKSEKKKLSEQLAALQQSQKETENQINSLSETIRKKQGQIEAMVGIVDEYEDEMRELKARRADLFDELNKRKVDNARAEEKWSAMKAEIARIKNQVADIEKMRTSYQQDHDNSVAIIAEIEKRNNADRESIERMGKQVDEMKADIDQRQKDIGDLQRARKSMELQRKEIEDQLQRLDKQVANFDSVIAEKKGYVESILQKFRETYMVDVREIQIEEKSNLDNITERINELRNALVGLGDVNLLAIEQYHAAKERLGFLQTQKADSEKAMEDIRALIQETNEKSIQQFTAAFEDIRKAFKKIFARLFDGGKADLVLMDERDVLNSGINIMAEPPGKKFQSISLMSGGERALVAIAVIFAILYLKPTPFVVLDEMDAPLDDDNIERFKSLLYDFRETSQFIIVSHSKSTLEICNALYGVTMEEQGVSKVVNVAFDEANVLFKSEEKKPE
jgi:chromosome segregation protein